MTRQCGDCTLCCKLLPVKSLDKPANTRCQHQRTHKGCAIYERRPFDCRLWDCHWLSQPDDTPDLSRPDRVHYVIDTALDFVTACDDVTGQRTKVAAIQLWVDPKFPDAHRDPALRAWLAEQGERGIVCLVRYNSLDGFTLVPPAMNKDRVFMELTSSFNEEAEHSFAERLQALGELEMGEAFSKAVEHVRD